MVKNSPAKAGDIRTKGSTPGLGRSPGGGHGNPLRRESDTPEVTQQSCIHTNNYSIYNEQDTAKYFSHNMCNPLHSPMKGMLLSTFYK